MRALRVLATLYLLALAGAGAVAAADPQPGAVYGTASTWAGPGAATHDCVWPWTSCAPRAVQSLDTGLVIYVTPTMYCDCFVGRTGPLGETERLVDLDPAMTAALGLPGPGLYDVAVWPIDQVTGLPDAATAKVPEDDAGELVASVVLFLLIAVGLGLTSREHR